MPTFRFNVKHTGNCNNIQFDKGMTVDVITPTTSNPLLTNDGKLVGDAFMRIYGIDAKRAGLLSSGMLDYKLL